MREDVITLCADNAMLVLDEIADAIGTGHAGHSRCGAWPGARGGSQSAAIARLGDAAFFATKTLAAVVDSGVSARDVLEGARPKPHFSRKAALEQQVRLWSDQALATATERLLMATATAADLWAVRNHHAPGFSGADADGGTTLSRAQRWSFSMTRSSCSSER